MDANNTTTKRSAGRPRAFDRAAALEIALDLFWRRGYESTSTTQLTAAMGIAQPSLYAAFGSKEALYRETLDLYLARYSGAMQKMSLARGSARNDIAQLLVDVAKQFTDRTHAPGCMVASSGLQGEPVHAELHDYVAGLRQTSEAAIRQRLATAVASGELPNATHIASLAAYFSMVIQGMSVQAHDGASLALLKRLADLAMAAWPEPQH